METLFDLNTYPSPRLLHMKPWGQCFPGAKFSRFPKETLDKAQQGDNLKAEQVKMFIVSVNTMEFIQSAEREASWKVDIHMQRKQFAW